VGGRGSDALIDAVRSLDAAGIQTHGLGLRRPSLDDVFLALTGHAAEEDGQNGGRRRGRPRGRPHPPQAGAPGPPSPGPPGQPPPPPASPRRRWGAGDPAPSPRRTLLVWMRVPAYIVFTVIQPVIFVLMFRYVFGGAIAVPGVKGGYVSFLMPGIIGQT